MPEANEESKIKIELGDVQKTLFLPLWGRAYETRKPRGLLRDETAVRILEQVDYDFDSLAGKMSPLSQAAWVMRSLCVDEVIRKFLEEYPDGSVVNVGCGMDTTFERVDNGRMRWYDLDLPDVIALRRNFISENERRTMIASSFLDEAWLEQIEINGNVLFIAAGVLYYFEEEEVKQFFLRLARRFAGCQAIFDVASPQGVRTANQMVIERSGLDEGSYLRWALESPADLPDWGGGIRVLEVIRYFGRRGRRLPLKTRLFGLLSDYLKIQYMVHIAIDGSEDE